MTWRAKSAMPYLSVVRFLVLGLVADVADFAGRVVVAPVRVHLVVAGRFAT